MLQRNLILCLVLMGSCLVAQPAADNDARTVLNRGVAAFKAAHYADAVSAFEQAVKLEPGNPAPYLYLGTALMTQWIPGAESAENAAFATRAEVAFRTALNLSPQDKTALASLASLAFNSGKAIRDGVVRLRHFDDAEAWYKKLLDVDPNDKIALFSLGVIAWERFYPEVMMARANLAMKPEDPGPLPDAGMRADLRARLGQAVANGIASLQRAIVVDPQYDDAMAYLNLLYRERADLSESVADYKRDIATADELVAKALEAKKQKGQSASNSYSAPPQPPPPAPGVERIRVGGNVQAYNLIQKPVPVYPPLAKQARVQGTVRFSVVIGADGRMVHVQLISGHPLLVPAATEAVRQYVYRETLLNGQPVEVATQVDVNFALN